MRLVLLHALPLDGRMWDAARPLFDGAFAPTLYGLGESVRDWAAAILEHCGSQELLIVGNSVGGSCALEVARAAPDQVRGVVLVGAKAGVRRDPRTRDDAVRLLRHEGVEGAWDRYWAPLFSAQAEPEVVSAARKLALEQDGADLITGVRAFYDRRDHSEFLRAWSGQLLVVSGIEDRSPTPAAAARSVEGTGATQVIVEGAGHYVPLERPSVLHRAIAKQLRILQE